MEYHLELSESEGHDRRNEAPSVLAKQPHAPGRRARYESRAPLRRCFHHLGGQIVCSGNP